MSYDLIANGLKESEANYVESSELYAIFSKNIYSNIHGHTRAICNEQCSRKKISELDVFVW